MSARSASAKMRTISGCGGGSGRGARLLSSSSSGVAGRCDLERRRAFHVGASVRPLGRRLEAPAVAPLLRHGAKEGTSPARRDEKHATIANVREVRVDQAIAAKCAK